MNSQNNNHKNNDIDSWARNTLLASIAQRKGYCFTQGRLLEGGIVVAEDDNSIAKKLLGQMTTADHTASVDSILSVITKLYNYDQLIESAKPLLAERGIQLPESQNIESRKTGTVEWFKRMTDICGV